jgi:hypothetical protein
MGKIPCFVLIYEQVAIIKACLDFLVKHADRLELIIIENASANTPIIQPYVQELIDRGLVTRYYQFAENITNNAYNLVLEAAQAAYLDPSVYPYTIITDGDVTVANQGWLDELIRILTSDTEIFAAGVDVDLFNLPVNAIPEAVHWVPRGEDRGTYIKAPTGYHLVLTRTFHLLQYLDHRRATNQRFLDSNMNRFAESLGLFWAKTTEIKACHLTWGLYSDLSNPYTQMKLGTATTVWNHDRIAPYRVLTAES